MSAHATMSADGRIDLPADVRRHLGLPEGGSVVIEETEDGLLLRSVDQAVERARTILRQNETAWAATSVDDFLATRRAENDS